MTVSPRRWEERRCFCFLCGPKHSSGRGTAGGCLVGSLKVFSPCCRLCVLFPGCESWRRARSAVREAQTRAGRCGLRDTPGRGQGWHCCRELWKSLAGGEQWGWKWSRPPRPPVAFTRCCCVKSWTRGLQVRGVFRNMRERWRGMVLTGPLCPPWGRGVPGRGARAPRLCRLFSPPTHFHALIPHSRGFACAAGGAVLRSVRGVWGSLGPRQSFADAVV